MRIIEHIQDNGRITTVEVAKMFAITRQAALKALKKLVDLAVVKLIGHGRGAQYILTQTPQINP